MAGRRFPKLFEMFDLEKKEKKRLCVYSESSSQDQTRDPQKEIRRRRRRRKLGVFTAEI